MNTNSSDFSNFTESACTRCGDCFHYCPELKLPREEARREIKRLIRSSKTKYVLQYCTTCFSCNLICPNDCKPYQLILERWNELYRKRGAPSIYRFVCPSLEGNIWEILYQLMPSDEKKLIQKWMKQEKKESILLISSYLHLFPFVFSNSSLLEHFTPVDIIDHWECGGYLYQGGYLDVVHKIAERTKEDFKDWNVKTVIPTLDAVEWMLNDVHPSEMGIKHDVEIINFHSWLLSKIESKSIVLNRQLGISVTLHDNCFSKVGGGKYWENPRKLIDLLGCRLIEMRHIQKYSLCCGFGAGASWTQHFRIVFDILYCSKKKFEEAEATGAQGLVTYCGGCLYLLWAARELLRSKIEVFHLVELVRLGMGEKIEYPQKHIERAWDIIAIINYHVILSLFRRNFWINQIKLKEFQSKTHSYFSVIIIRKLFSFSPIRLIYARLFKILLPIMKTQRSKLYSIK
ncbi:MAG: (Fe-S)-binding protein [Candidatus Heimdallarchaeota archaeon]|nr:(Fe-S)-binding protein [Candidatus Heimdallarchaeota archaeon]